MDDFKNYDVTCRTEGCGNSGILINILAPIVDPNIYCGVCGQPITDVVG